MDPSVKSPWNLVILSEGYKEDELQLFRNQVEGFVSRFVIASPFDLFKDVIKITRFDIASKQSGISEPGLCPPELPAIPVVNATFFDAELCGDGRLRRTIKLDEFLVNDTIGRHMGVDPDEIDAKLVFINSIKDGGSAGGGIGKLCIAPFTPTEDPAVAAAIFDHAIHTQIHELGHSGFGLADEYDFAHNSPQALASRLPPEPLLLADEVSKQESFTGPEPDEPNVTTVTTLTAVKWRDLILTPDLSPVPIMPNPDPKTCNRGPSPASTLSPSMEGAGLFEGAKYFRTKIFRPQFSCKMFTESTQFCVVCKRTILQKMWIRIFDTRKLVWALIQHILIRLTLLSELISGEPTPATIIALQDFQNNRSLPPSGKVDLTTWDALAQSLRDIIDVSTPDKILEHGKTSDDIKLLQRILWLLISPFGPPVPTPVIGAPPGLRDGVFGPLTFSSVRLFQRQKGFTEDGKVGPITLNGLIESLIPSYSLLESNF